MIADMKIATHGAEGFLLFPTQKTKDEKTLTRLHTHVYYDVCFAMDPPVTIMTETEERTFSHGLVIVPPRLKHVCCCDGTDGYCLAVTAENVKSMEGDCLLDYINLDDITALPINERLAYYLKSLAAEDVFSRLGKAKSRAFLQLVFLEIASLLSVQNTALPIVSVNQRSLYVEKIDRFVGQKYNTPTATLENLAKELYLSERQTSRIIKREYGCTFVQLINDKKMAVATFLLKNTHMPVSEIIKELCFETENYFYRMFKNRYGITPLQYRLVRAGSEQDKK